MTNAFKYAFPGSRRGEVRIRLESRSGYGELTIMDDGVGLPSEREGGGLRIVQALVTQIEGDLELLRHAGTRWILRFPLGIRNGETPIPIRRGVRVGELIPITQ